MIETEAIKVLTYLNRAGLVPALEGAGAVWADALSSVPFETAIWVAREMGRERTSDQRWVTPGDIAARVRQVRAQRVKDAQREGLDRYAPPEELEGDPRREIAWRNAYMEAVADGQSPEYADAAACAVMSVTRREVGPDIGPARFRALITQTTTTLTEGASA